MTIDHDTIHMNGPHLAHTAHALDTDIILAVPRTTAGDLIGMIGIVMTDDTAQGGAHGTGAVVLIDVNARPIAIVDVVVIDPSLLRYHKKKGTGLDKCVMHESSPIESHGAQKGMPSPHLLSLTHLLLSFASVGYVEFREEASVPNALALSGQKLSGIPVQVQLTEAEKNRLALQGQTNAPTSAYMPGQPALAAHDVMDQRLYVGSVNYSLTEHDLRQVFEPYGPIDFVDLHKDQVTGLSKGYAFIQFRNVKDAKEALTKMNGFELAGRNLKVGMVTERSQQPTNSNFTGGSDLGPLDDDSAGMTLNSTSRAELMRKLAARETDLMPGAEKVAQAPPPVAMMTKPVVVPSRTILLNNMFNPVEETEPDWVQELSVDIKEECQQYGTVEHIFVNPDSLGEVALKFVTVEAGQKAVQALNGRWFGGRQIQALFMPEGEYLARFGA
ncbi:hypothetical protein [Absidia glauca]|uniref:RRM domain-containing protein n=1 Tax=Absidia glauca TaxID=4829 RepID=A0A163MQK7_ABSGL|nr:hypothetical protein [Absidia glauca]